MKKMFKITLETTEYKSKPKLSITKIIEACSGDEYKNFHIETIE